MIKLIALDLDGTLLNSSGRIPEANAAAIRRAEEQGVLVTIATGRRFRDARPVGLEIGLNAPLICHNGALIKYADTLEVVAASLLAPQTLSEILRIGREFGADAMFSCDPVGKGVLFYERISDENVPLQKYIKWSQHLHGSEAADAVHHAPDLAAVIGRHDTVHVSFSGPCAPMYDLQRKLEFELDSVANVLATIYPHLDFTLIDILPAGASKGVAVEQLARAHGLSSEDVMAIGDNYNDLEMLEYAGVSVVMANASIELRQMEGFEETLSNDENGVAEAITRLVLGNSRPQVLE